MVVRVVGGVLSVHVSEVTTGHTAGGLRVIITGTLWLSCCLYLIQYHTTLIPKK